MPLSEIEVASALKSLRRAIETALRAVVARWVEGGAHFAAEAEGKV